MTLFTVPTGHRYLLKGLHIVNWQAGSRAWEVDIDTTKIFLQGTLAIAGAAGSWFDWSGFVALAAGQSMRYEGLTTSKVSLNLAGYDYPLTL